MRLVFLVSGLLNVFNYLSAVSDKIIDNSPSLTAVVAVFACFGVYRQHCSCGVLHYFYSYTFLAYGFNEHLPLGIYLPRMIASIKNFISTIKLFIGFIGWALCAFCYSGIFCTIPYFLTTSAMLAKWLLRA